MLFCIKLKSEAYFVNDFNVTAVYSGGIMAATHVDIYLLALTYRRSNTLASFNFFAVKLQESLTISDSSLFKTLV